MKTKIQKKEELKSLESKLPKSQITVFTSFARTGEKGLSVAQMTALKRLLREANSEYVVTKKTLIDIATKEIAKDDAVDVYGMAGSLGLVIGNDEPYSLAKRVYDFAKKNPALQFFGAFLEGHFISKEQFVEMAKMPSREVLIGRLFGMMKYPITSLYVVMSEIAKKQGAGAPVAEVKAVEAGEAEPRQEREASAPVETQEAAPEVVAEAPTESTETVNPETN